jgi:signal transduction histidine kinase/CheY-like chemotaxis protein
MLLAALLPVTLTAVLLAAGLLSVHLNDIDSAHIQRERSLAHQLASACEYGLFSFNIKHLQNVANGAMQEADVRSVVVLDLQQRMVASAGKTSYVMPARVSGEESISFDPVRRIDSVWVPVLAGQVKLDDLFETRNVRDTNSQQLLGHVLIEISHDTLDRRQREMLLIGALATIGSLLFAGAFALRLGRGVVRPILRISDMIERIGAGQVSARIEVRPGDPLHKVQLGLNQMAQQIQFDRDQLEQRVVAVTRELRQKKEEAETATLTKSRFLAVASHDLRQPTHALGMFVERLTQLPHDAQSRHLIASLETSVQAMQNMLDALLDLSQLEANAVHVHLRPLALAEIFRQIHHEVMTMALEKNLRLRIRPTQVWLFTDAVLLHRIILNLMVNGLRYTDRGGVLLACRLAADGAHAYIEVWDSGIGIASEHQDLIFKEFYQVDNAGRDRGNGLGLGLHIVARKSELLGHRLQMMSRPGRGTRFRLEVPLAPADASRERRQPPRPMVPDNLAGLHLLVIEDDPLAREALVMLLLSWGVRCQASDSLSGALKCLEQGDIPAVIVSDYHLQHGENGIQVIGQLRSHLGREIAGCLISGNTDQELMLAAKDARLTLLHKPVRPAKLRSLLHHLVEQANALE